MDAIAVVGFAYRLPQGMEDDASLWDVLVHGQNVMTEWPESRSNIDALYSSDSIRQNTVASRGAHFLQGDITAFDAPFFSMPASEAAAMDPQQRIVLETAYHAFENANIPVEDLSGSRMGVFAASMINDFSTLLSKDPDTMPRTSSTGIESSLLANKISWFFNLRGPSLHLNTACSGSLAALDQACKSIQAGDADSAIVMGSSLLLSPEASIALSNMGFLSPDGLCYSFDHRANGYSRGEGVVALVIRPLKPALERGEVIRAVIRGIATNQDGKTPTLTQPSSEAQQRLIEHVYAKAQIHPSHTYYIEAHGTGTTVGDPLEMKAIGQVFRHHRSPDDPLYVGSIKSNIGHLEASSGLAGVLKAILAIEKAVIPPNALFQKLNPSIDADFLCVKVPEVPVSWPLDPGVRRASVNSFGFGGTNAHVILDDALHYLTERGATGHHNCTIFEPVPHSDKVVAVNGTTYSTNGSDLSRDFLDEISTGASARDSTRPKLLVWTAADRAALGRVVGLAGDFFSAHIQGSSYKTSQLAYTLATRRSFMPWRTFALVEPLQDNIDDLETSLTYSPPVRESNDKLSIALVFTGQGAQYAGMGVALAVYPKFKDAIDCCGAMFTSFGAQWSIWDVLQDETKIHLPVYSQPICTALQIALIALLRQFSVPVSAVVGHSSGEIAASYVAGALDLESACKVAYFRGQIADKLQKDSAAQPGAMMSVNLAESDVHVYLNSASIHIQDLNSLHVACINSPDNCTLSGPEYVINQLKDYLDSDGVFSQKLNTGVAYHSPSMHKAAAEYLDMLATLKPAEDDTGAVLMASSVTGNLVPPSMTSAAQYWVDNLISPVQFHQAVQALTGAINVGKGDPLQITDTIEVGPHAALKRPVMASASTPTRYHSVLHRHKAPAPTVLSLVGTLFCHGHDVSVAAVNGHDGPVSECPPPLVNLPKYPFDHSKTYWALGRLANEFRFRPSTDCQFLGRPTLDFNPLRPTYRSFLSVEAMPWLGDHTVMGSVIYPGTGMLMMCIEAALLSASHRSIISYFIEEIDLLEALPVAQRIQEATEVVQYLQPMKDTYDKQVSRFTSSIQSYSNETWSENCQTKLRIQYEPSANSQVDNSLEGELETQRLRHLQQVAMEVCTTPLEAARFYSFCESMGLCYGPSFQLLTDIFSNDGDMARARIEMDPETHQTSGSPVHPAILDAAIQLCYVIISKNLTSLSHVYIPRALRKVWISASSWTKRASTTIHVTSSVKTDPVLGMICTTTIIADDGKPLCWIEQGILTSISKKQEDKTDQANERRVLYRIDWKPALNLMTTENIQEYCRGIEPPETSILLTGALQDLLISAAGRTLRRLAAAKVDTTALPSHMQKFVIWLQAHCSDADDFDDEIFDRRLTDYETTHPTLSICIAVARNLFDIIQGNTEMLHLLFESQAAEIFYQAVFVEVFDARAQRFLELASHQNPGLRILEVGAGTGSLTSFVLGCMTEFEKRTGSAGFAEYTYSDISAGFFEKARAKFSDFSDRMIFKPLDLELDCHKQGFELQSYDLILAGSVIHATKDLSKTLANVHSLLKPGGQLLFHESTRPDCPFINFTFGPLPGWWLATEPWRQSGPLVTSNVWDQVLKECSFSGCQFNIQGPSGMSFLSATALDKTPSPLLSLPFHRTRITLLVEPQDPFQAALAQAFTAKYSDTVVVNFTKEAIDSADRADDAILVSLLEVGHPRLSMLSQGDFVNLQTVMDLSDKILWLSAASENPPPAQTSTLTPCFGLATGLLRSLRIEYGAKRILGVSVESLDAASQTESDVNTYLECIESIVNNGFAPSSLHPSESDFIVRNGVIHISRLTHDSQLEEDQRSLRIRQLRQETLYTGPATKLCIGSPGLLETLRWEEDASHESEALEPNQVEIEAQIWPISFRDVFTALGRMHGQHFGFECAGTVRRIGSAVRHRFQVGDRVCMARSGKIRMYPRSIADYVFSIPDGTSLTDVVSCINPGAVAYHGLINVARLQKGEKVLIHSAAGATGQMAVWIAKEVGAEVFATVGFDNKRALLVNTFGIPSDHILHSRSTSFAQGIKRLTNGYGVDVVLNSLSGDGMRASWECMAPGGRFIEIGKSDIHGNSSLPMANFARNVSFCAVDFSYIADTNVPLASELVQNTIDMVISGRLRPMAPVHEYPASQVEAAFRLMQSGKHTGRIAISLKDKTDVVPKFSVKKRTWSFPSNATYVIAGGFGGIGRALIQWMVSKGARNFIIPSRSGGSSQAAKQLVQELTQSGISIVSTRCDVSSSAQLQDLIHRQCAGMPPIRGCINCTLDLQDAVFSSMTYTQWQKCIRAKVDSSWNLHQTLPGDMDFFIMLSSLAGIYGSIAQSNYAAGCTFQDALAQHRTAIGCGKLSLSIDLGWMKDIGIISETAAYQTFRHNVGDMTPIYTDEFIGLFEHYCDPSLPFHSDDGHGSQIAVGAATQMDLVPPQKNAAFASLPMLQGFGVAAARASKERRAARTTTTVPQDSPIDMFRRADGEYARAAIVVASLVKKLSQFSSILEQDINPRKPLSDFGVDSLMAVEIRNWFLREFDAVIAVFDIMGGNTSLTQIGNLVAKRSKL